MTESPLRRSTARKLIIAAVAVVGGLLFALLLGEALREERIAATELIRLNNLGIDRLENGRPTEAIEAFQAIVDRRPDLVLGHQNLTIARLVDLAGGTAPDAVRAKIDPRKVELANAALEELEQRDSDSAVTAVLAARIAHASGNFQAAQLSYIEAVKRAPKASWINYERYRFNLGGESAMRHNIASSTLAIAHRTDPTNIWIAGVDMLSENLEHPRMVQVSVFDHAIILLQPFAAGIEQRTGENVVALLNEAIAARFSRDWDTIERNIRLVVKIVRSEDVARRDLARVYLDSLQFVEVDFPPEFYLSVGLEQPTGFSPVPALPDSGATDRPPEAP